jgi:cysteinyl-tRNA synthetase
MHNGFLQVEGEKMSKSLGNFVTIHELLASKKFGGRTWPGAVIRLAMLMTHYRQPLDWTLSRMQEAESRRIGWLGPPHSRGLPEEGVVPEILVESLADDLNVIGAFSILDKLAKSARAVGEDSLTAANNLACSLVWLGLADRERDFAEARADSDHLRDIIRAAAVGVSAEFIREKLDARLAARKAKDFKEADRIRDELAAMGIALKDAKDPATGEIVTTWEVTR